MRAQKDRLYRDVEFLTKIRPFRHYWNPDSYRNVSNYTREEFMKSGFEVEKQTWRVGNEKLANIIASYNKVKSKRLVIGVHYDDPERTPGTEDSGSALACLLETARMVQENKSEIDYRIDFVAYNLEEPPFFGYHNMGSYRHARSLVSVNADVMGMICYEMTGFLSNQEVLDKSGSELCAMLEKHHDNNDHIVVSGREDFAYFNEQVYRLMAEDSELDVKLRNLPKYGDWTGVLDHQNYLLFEYPALMINDTAFLRNPYYHKRSEIIDALDFDRMAEVVNGAYKAVIGLKHELP